MSAKTPKYQHIANPLRAAADAERARSNAWGTHRGSRPKDFPRARQRAYAISEAR